MDINATLFGEIITFIVFVWFTMKFVWPPLMKIMEQRRAKIADGLAAAEQGQKELELAQHKSKDMLTEAKTQAALILEQANQRAHHVVEEAKHKAREEGDRLLAMANEEITQEYNAAKDKLMKKVTGIAVAGAEKILQREVDKSTNDDLINELLGEL